MGGGNQSVVYSTPIEGSKEEGFSHIYRNTKFMDKLYSTPESDIRSIRDVLVKSCL